MLEDKVRQVFSDMVVLKDPKRSEFFSNLSMPSYMRDWLESRAAWLTVEFNKTYVPTVGDAYADGRLNICDVTAIQLYLVDRAPEKFDAKAADYDKNGSVTVDDATKLQLRLANY